MARSKETLVFVLDVSPSMHPYLGHVSSAAASVVERKLFNNKSDEVGLVLFGMEETDNDLRREVGEAYEGIVSEPITLVDGEQVKKLRSLPKGCYAGDYVDAVVVAVDTIFKKYGDAKKGNKRICLITDALSPLKESTTDMTMDEQVDKIVDRMEGLGIRLDAAVIRINDESILDSSSENINILETMCSRTHGELTTVENPLYLLSALKPRIVSPTTLFRGDLEVTPNMRIKVWVYKKAAQERVPSLKIYSDKAPQNDELASHIVKMDTDYKSSDDPNVSIPKAQRAKGYYYGQQLIPVTPDMELALKFTAEKGLKLLGFTDAANIPRHYYMKEPNLFVPEPSQKSSLAISAIARALKQANMVALVRCVWRQGQRNVVLGVLTPNLSFEDGIADSLYFNVIPFAEDIREFGFASFDDRPASQLPSKQQEEATDLLVQMLDLSPSDAAESLQPEKTSNPVLQRFYHFLYLKSLNPDAAVPQLDESTKKIIEPEFESDLIAKLEGLCSQFTLVNVQKTKNTSNFWKDRIEAAAANDDPEAKPDPDAAGAGLSFDSFSSRQIDEVGSLNPVQDFEALLARRDGAHWVGKAIQGMKKIITDLLESSYKGNTYDKAMACLAALRNGCVIQEEPKEFNDYLYVLAEKCQSKRLSDFWEMVIEKKLTLISKAEVSDSEITEDAAMEFLTARVIKEEPAAAEEAEELDEMDALLGEAV